MYTPADIKGIEKFELRQELEVCNDYKITVPLASKPISAKQEIINQEVVLVIWCEVYKSFSHISKSVDIYIVPTCEVMPFVLPPDAVFLETIIDANAFEWHIYYRG